MDDDRDELLERLQAAEAVIAAALGANSIEATVKAIDAYEARYGPVTPRELTEEELSELAGG